MPTQEEIDEQRLELENDALEAQIQGLRNKPQSRLGGILSGAARGMSAASQGQVKQSPGLGRMEGLLLGASGAYSGAVAQDEQQQKNRMESSEKALKVLKETGEDMVTVTDQALATKLGIPLGSRVRPSALFGYLGRTESANTRKLAEDYKTASLERISNAKTAEDKRQARVKNAADAVALAVKATSESDFKTATMLYEIANQEREAMKLEGVIEGPAKRKIPGLGIPIPGTQKGPTLNTGETRVSNPETNVGPKSYNTDRLIRRTGETKTYKLKQGSPLPSGWELAE